MCSQRHFKVSKIFQGEHSPGPPNKLVSSFSTRTPLPRKILATRLGLTGCDTTSSLAVVGRKKARAALCCNEQHRESLGMVSQTATLDEVSKMNGEEFICSLYPAAKKTPRSTHELRYLMLCQKRHKKQLLPPTTDSVVQHVRRVSYQAFS